MHLWRVGMTRNGYSTKTWTMDKYQQLLGSAKRKKDKGFNIGKEFKYAVFFYSSCQGVQWNPPARSLALLKTRLKLHPVSGEDWNQALVHHTCWSRGLTMRACSLSEPGCQISGIYTSWWNQGNNTISYEQFTTFYFTLPADSGETKLLEGGVEVCTSILESWWKTGIITQWELPRFA